MASMPACASSMPIHACGGTPSPAQAARKISGSGFEFLSWEASAQKVKNSRSSSAAKIVGAFRETEASPTGICCARRSASKERMPGRTALTVNSRSEWTYSRFLRYASCALSCELKSPSLPPCCRMRRRDSSRLIPFRDSLNCASMLMPISAAICCHAWKCRCAVSVITPSRSKITPCSFIHPPDVW